MKNISDKQLQLLELAKQAHAHQSRSKGKIPYWHHVQSVREIIYNAFATTKELEHDPQLLDDLLLVAIGHDLYEDTKVTRSQIQSQFGDRVDQFIFLLTNEDGDDNRTRYVQKVKNASEEIKLIKIADLTENSISVAYSLHDLGIEWVDSFYLPIVEEMRPIVTETDYKIYSKTAVVLLNNLDFAFQRLYENIEKYR